MKLIKQENNFYYFATDKDRLDFNLPFIKELFELINKEFSYEYKLTINHTPKEDYNVILELI